MRGIGSAMENKEKLQEQELRQEQEQKQERKQKWTESKLKSKLLICLLYVAVLSAATYAWFTLNNKPKVYNLAITANGAADLLIADDLGNGPGEYGDELDLQNARQDPFPMDEMLLNPVTTADVKTFHAPVYGDGNVVTDVEEITDEEELYESYVYKKTFYLKAGSFKNSQGKTVTRQTRYYDIMLLGRDQGEEYTGCQINQAAGSGAEATAANSIRIAFILGEGQSGQNEIFVYEPNSNQHNDGESARNEAPAQYGAYKTVKQPTALADFEEGENGNSEALFTIQEEEDVKVTMLVWVEGTDEDCTNSIQMDDILGNIQFVSKETTGSANGR